MSSSDLGYRSGEANHLSEVRSVLLGCRNAGKSSSGNTILGREDFDLQESAQCVMRHGEVAGRKITVVEAPGWQRNKAVRNSSDLLKQEIVHSVSMCPPGPHAVLLVLRLDFKSWKSEKNVLQGYLNLLGDNVWHHTIVLFTFGDSLGDSTIEQHIERGEAYIQWLIEKCGNRYHVFNNKKRDDDSQVTELLEKIEMMVAGNRGCHLEMDTKVLTKVEHETKKKKKEKKSKVEESAAPNSPPVRRPAKMVSPIPSGPLSHTHQNNPGKVFEPEDQCNPKLTHSTQVKGPATSQKHQPADIQQFTPELGEICAEDKNGHEYRFLCPHAGQFMCKLTNLVFEMEGKGEVLYRIVSWDSRLLDELGQKPAGPLYNIDCLEGSICHLHLPHCETRTDVVELTVAHVTDGNMEIIQPLKVTNTHVIINIQGLSRFGLMISRWSINKKAQVLLFYEKRMSKLYIHLLPKNVPVKEVQKIHEGNTYIMTSSKCQLTPGKKYRPCCKTTDCDYVSQPEDEKFDCDYDPNYHPTFEVLFDPAVNKVTLSVIDEKDQVVWRPRMVLLTGTERASPGMDTTGADFVDQHREKLIQRVFSVMEIADRLKSKKMISDEMYSNISVESSSYKQMRLLYRSLDSGGRAVKAEFYKILREKQPFIVDDLESGVSLT
ncbi:hypothetical protein PHYPO_G00162600 [Pangasianodon hypophthalmus]|uniref:AIG1-type G domain-containing protein n=1 Tax=Pangasianodon hypophthalmus TaxID=310915 RepID=A0A5N5JTZ3_PANHP|nr:hypothetical protein PHYPO_G00162600 [Pangasianodon hypophthalmus]